MTMSLKVPFIQRLNYNKHRAERFFVPNGSSKLLKTRSADIYDFSLVHKITERPERL